VVYAKGSNIYADPYIENMSSAAYGESQVVEFEIIPDKLSFYNGKKLIKPGGFKVMVGPNSRDVQTLDFTFE